MFFQALALPRAGHSLDEYEDAADADAARGRFAVADGASESGFARAWARLLVAEFVRGDGDGWDWLEPLRQRWADEVGAGELPWFAETKFQQGAFATFLGVVVRDGGWRAVAVGDSCLFQVRDGRLLRTFPLTGAAQFGACPRLVRSRDFDPGAAEERACGEWASGDSLWLMTDALAQWCLAECEAQRDPWPELERAAENAEAFAAWAQELRDGRGLRNDDVTALLVRPEAP